MNGKEITKAPIGYGRYAPVKMAVYWPLWFFFYFFFFKISALRFSYLYFLCSLTALDFALIKKRLSMLLILKNCGEERKIVRVGTPGQRPVISRKAL